MTYQQSSSSQLQDHVLYQTYFGYITTGSFVEVGAFNGYNWSNTYGLAMAGWRGLLFEPQPDLCAECRRLYAGYPGITIEQCCIGKENGETNLYLGGSLSTTKPETIEIYNSLPWSSFVGLNLDKFIVCQVYTLDFMLERHNWPVGFEVLVIDVEGAELDVLAGFDVNRWRPQMCIVETHEQNQDDRLRAKAGPIGDYFDRAGYSKIHADYINTVYWKKYDDRTK